MLRRIESGYSSAPRTKRSKVVTRKRVWKHNMFRTAWKRSSEWKGLLRTEQRRRNGNFLLGLQLLPGRVWTCVLVRMYRRWDELMQGSTVTYLSIPGTSTVGLLDTVHLSSIGKTVLFQLYASVYTTIWTRRGLPAFPISVFYNQLLAALLS